MLGQVGGGGGGEGWRRHCLSFGAFSSAPFLQVCDVAVTLVVHLPGFPEDPASFDVCWQEIESEVRQVCYIC